MGAVQIVNLVMCCCSACRWRTCVAMIALMWGCDRVGQEGPQDNKGERQAMLVSIPLLVSQFFMLPVYVAGL
jgi:hypothetical protein